MSLFVIDVEADGPCPGLYSMVSFGAVKVGTYLKTTFYGQTAPISNNYIPEALAVSNTSRTEHNLYPDPIVTMNEFKKWINYNTIGKPVFISDNPAFDWQFINYYFHRYSNENPFGFSARRIGDFYAGLTNNWNNANDWKKLRKTAHTHNPVDDAKGNAEALLTMAKNYNIKLPI